jgi:thiamine biosynthesis lipoprotein
MKKFTAILLIIITILSFTAGCTDKPAVASDSAFALDTIVQIKIYYKNSRNHDEDIFEKAFTLINDLENTLSVHVQGSDIYNVKENAGIQSVEVAPIAYSVVKDSIEYSRATDGLFDVTSGPLIDLWAIDPPNGHVPSAGELSAVMPLIDYTKIDLSNENEIYLQNENMIINLGAIAKGTIADEVKSMLLDEGISSCFINLGGNVLLIGGKPDGSDFSIGIQNPFDLRGAYIMALKANDVAVVSSGDYERYFEYEGEIYHHILNTETGYPAQTNIKQVSIIAPTSQMADALSTSVLLLGIEDGLKLIKSYEGVEAVFITKDKEVYITEALRDKITYSQEQADGFVIVEDASVLYD